MSTDKGRKRVPHHEKQREESPEQKQAFETYFLMGEDRSYRKLAKSMNKGITTISNWAKWFDWQERLEDRERQVDKIIENRNNKTMSEIKMEQARQIDAVMNRFWEKVTQGKIEIETWSDYERLWKIRQEIGGETERTKSNALAQLTDAITRVGQTFISQAGDVDGD